MPDWQRPGRGDTRIVGFRAQGGSPPLRRAAVLPARGIGDALLMAVAAHHLSCAGYETHLFHPQLVALQAWFPHLRLSPLVPHDLSSYEELIVQNDNSAQVLEWKRSYPHLSIFYPTYRLGKHLPLTPQDRVFDPARPMAENVARAMQERFPLDAALAPPWKSSGLQCPPGRPLLFKRYPRRVILHPTSSAPHKNWRSASFVALARRLAQRGWEPLFLVHRSEECLVPFPSGVFEDLDALASLLYEAAYAIGNDSLVGHLASNLGLPTLIVADDAERMRLWRPGWCAGEIATPPRWLRKRRWQRFLSVGRVWRAFVRLQQLGV